MIMVCNGDRHDARRIMAHISDMVTCAALHVRGTIMVIGMIQVMAHHSGMVTCASTRDSGYLHMFEALLPQLQKGSRPCPPNASYFILYTTRARGTRYAVSIV